jgi:hypothetical protein
MMLSFMMLEIVLLLLLYESPDIIRKPFDVAGYLRWR